MGRRMAEEAVDLAAVDAVVAGIGRGRESAIPILQAIQRHFGYLPEAALRRVAETTEIGAADLVGVASFYTQFRRRPAGRHTVKVCVGTACHVQGAEATFEAFKRHLGIGGAADTDAERLFTVEKVACLGCCMLAPAVQIDDVIYGHVHPDRVQRVVGDFLRSGKLEAGADGAAMPGSVDGEVRLCGCSSCRAAGAEKVRVALLQAIAAAGLPVAVTSVGCTGVSYEAPLLEVRVGQDEVFRYGRMTVAEAPRVLARHFRPRSLPQRVRMAAERLLGLLLTDAQWEPVTRYAVDTRHGDAAAYWQRQRRLATEWCGEMDPLDLAAYAEHGGFRGLRRALEAGPEAVLDELEAAGLRGRGGAGFPTARKWRQVLAAERPKYVICNGDEGDPGAFMDRMLLESFPFRIVEGMAIAAATVGAEEGVLYVRAEYPLATARMREALGRCEAAGFLGDDVLGSGRRLHLRVVEGAGAFVCGEESALVAALEGRRGAPRFRPPYPSEFGFRRRPTLVNNVETFSLVPWIVRNGAAAFAALGTATSKGTKTFALAGKVRRGGLVEVPMGMTLRQIVEEIGGGMPEGRVLKAIQVGGPSGGCLPASLADTPVDYEALTELGVIMGSGGLVVLDDTDCMVDVARYFTEFAQHESCGKCTFCRVGTKRMLEVLERICEGKGQAGDLDALAELGREVARGSLCGLGRTAPNPVLSTLRHFRAEYEAHLKGRCPAGKCSALIRYKITEACIGCTRCAQICPAGAIPFTPYERHRIERRKCIRCDGCRQACPVGAVVVR